MSAKSIELEIFGKKYYFRSDDPDALKRNADYLNSQLEEMNRKFNTVDRNKLFVLYSLVLTEKYLAEKEKVENLNKEVEQIHDLLNKITLEG